MTSNKLNVLPSDKNDENKTDSIRKLSFSPNSRRDEAQARFERLWLQDPEKFNPLNNCIGRERIFRTWKAIEPLLINPIGMKVVDLGCGSGALTLKLSQAGVHVDAVDIASNALKKNSLSDGNNITLIQDWVPKTQLADQAYDLVICTDLIAELHPHDFRLFFSELARLVKPEGFIVCSTPLDTNASDALENFEKLAETELVIKQWIFSYHSYFLQLCSFIDTPTFYYQASKNEEFRKEQFKKRKGLSRLWFQWNSSKIMSPIWRLEKFAFQPICDYLKQATRLMIFLEKICKFFNPESGISHALFVAQRKPLNPPKPTPILGKIRTKKWE